MCRTPPSRDPRAMPPVIEVSELRKSYGGRPVVDGVTSAVEEGEIFGILGPNGAGKTTTVECVGGLRAPDAGRVRGPGPPPGGRPGGSRPRPRRPAPAGATPGRAD